MSRYSPTVVDYAVAAAFGRDALLANTPNPLAHYSAHALTKARSQVRRVLREGLCPDTPERRREYQEAIDRLSKELGRRWQAKYDANQTAVARAVADGRL